MIFKYIYLRGSTKLDAPFLAELLLSTTINMIKRYQKTKMWPEMNGNRIALSKSVYEKSDEYLCDSSIFILTLFELMAYTNLSSLYMTLKDLVEESGVNLQIPYPILMGNDIEQSLFEHRLYNETSVQANVKLPDSLDEFKKSFRKPYDSIDFRTKRARYGFLLLLAHKFYQTDLFPDYISRDFCCAIK